MTRAGWATVTGAVGDAVAPSQLNSPVSGSRSARQQRPELRADIQPTLLERTYVVFRARDTSACGTCRARSGWNAMIPRRLRTRTGGFTLIELIVALFITAIIFTVGYGAINQALRHHEEVKDHQARLTEVQNAVRVMVQDFSELAARPVRDPLGQNWLGAITAQAPGTLAGSTNTGTSDASGSAPAAPDADDDDDDDSSAPTDDGGPDLVVFTRAGWANPAGIQRPTLERVSYRFANGTLRRMHWVVLDSTEASVPGAP